MLTRALTYLPRAWKAITAGALAGSGAYAAALKDGVMASEWIVIVAAVLAAAVGTWIVPNKAPVA